MRSETIQSKFWKEKVELKLFYCQSQEYLQIARKIREFYFKNVAINRQSVNEYMQLLSDLNFSYGIDKSARQHASKSKGKTFYYR